MRASGCEVDFPRASCRHPDHPAPKQGVLFIALGVPGAPLKASPNPGLLLSASNCVVFYYVGSIVGFCSAEFVSKFYFESCYNKVRVNLNLVEHLQMTLCNKLVR